jgi:D-sedoheptulose 7-phosphate isomerase
MNRGRLVDEMIAHVDATKRSLGALLDDMDRIETWGRSLACTLSTGGRLLTVGNGGSAAHAQHLASELVGRYRDERGPLAAIALASDPSTVTALMNDYGTEHVFARQVCAHARSGDVVLAFSTSGRSANILASASAARALGVQAWAITGPAPNPLAASADDSIVVDAASTAIVQEIHQVLVHLLCEAVEAALPKTQCASIGLEDGQHG